MSINISGFEMSIDEDARKKQVVFNQRMVEQSNGLLAPINSQERYLSVSSGHVSQFVKAILAECVTNQSNLADAGGRLNRQFLSRDPELKKALEAGWAWTVISSAAEAVWPSLPSLAEKALNSANSVFEGHGEVELLLQLLQASAGGLELQAAASSLAATGPLSSYSHFLAKWLELYSSRGEFLKFLHPFSKEFGHGCNCGEEFWSLCSSSSFSMQHPMLRLAMLAANFTAPTAKVSSGIARLIVPADFIKLKAKKQQALMDEVEQALYLGWVKVSSEMPKLTAVKAFGVLAIRCILHLLGKESFS